MNDRKVDLLLVVNMFLTGFDAKSLSTLYVDKNLRNHGLVQAYSRTNRTLNEVKSQGNIVVFRNVKKQTDEAIALFSNVRAKEEIFAPPSEEHVARVNETVVELLNFAPTAASVKALADEEADPVHPGPARAAVGREPDRAGGDPQADPRQLGRRAGVA